MPPSIPVSLLASTVSMPYVYTFNTFRQEGRPLCLSSTRFTVGLEESLPSITRFTVGLERRPLGGVSSLFYAGRRPSWVGFLLGFVWKEALLGGFPPWFCMNRGPPGWVSSLVLYAKRPSWVGISPVLR